MNRPLLSLIAVVLVALLSQDAWGQLRVSDFCRVKGQEENTLQGLGLVVGLRGTGDSEIAPTTRALAQILNLMDSPVSSDGTGSPDLEELVRAKNVALVFVTATVPAAGARQGDQLNCTVSAAFNAKSLDGGMLMITPLLGPRPGSKRVYALCQGALHVDDPARATTATVHSGCRLEEDFFNPFVQDGKIMLVLKKNHAGFHTASEIAELLRTSPDFRQSNGSYVDDIARAIDQVNIEVSVPQNYAEEPAAFVTQVLDQRVFRPQSDGRVVINERVGTVVIGANVEIGAVAVTHRNFSVEAGPFAQLSTESDEEATKLKTLVDALNAVKATPADIIDIIKGLERNGQLYGELIIE
ncbi:flagellar basal body P-ring protein FlgI [Lignipirellula cremea]|uniref:Flagellar P-ring protein n=1 Tax=Lignipirellula cremea TaxID=2528010 RepID=A0A518DR56_9BACT|nr:flagellar basal body P-ring protein FlgI [Lignipirellula cremea]QDU94309.1 Flagellar P-ring protein precursor [Lignipirellula cremea]